MSKVIIPTPLRALTGGKGQVDADGTTVRTLIEDLERRYPGIKERLLDQEGKLRRFINVYVEKEDIRFMDGLDTVVPESAEVSILPAIAGGDS